MTARNAEPVKGLTVSTVADNSLCLGRPPPRMRCSHSGSLYFHYCKSKSVRTGRRSDAAIRLAISRAIDADSCRAGPYPRRSRRARTIRCRAHCCARHRLRARRPKISQCRKISRNGDICHTRGHRRFDRFRYRPRRFNLLLARWPNRYAIGAYRQGLGEFTSECSRCCQRAQGVTRREPDGHIIRAQRVVQLGSCAAFILNSDFAIAKWFVLAGTLE
jgi:hypothetical protein